MRFLNKPDLEALGIRWTNIHLRRLEAAGKFPKRVQVGENSIAWIEEEIDAWQAARAAARVSKAAEDATPTQQPARAEA